MKYTILFYEAESDFAKRESADAPEYWGAWSAYIDLLFDQKLFEPGTGAGLQVPSTASTVRTNGGQTLIQGGPIADTKEQLAGFLIIDVPSLDEALDWATKAPCASTGAVEVRPVLAPPPSA